MPSKRRTKSVAAALLSLAAFWMACADTATNPQQLPVAAGSLPDDVQGAAMAPFGAAGEAIAFGDFAAIGGRQVLVVHRLGSARQPAQNAPSAPQKTETTVDVIRVSILSREGNNWKEAFRADGHLKNRRGYLDESPVTVSAWRMGYEKTADSGFRLEFTALDLPPGSKPVSVRVGWNPNLKEYDALDAAGTRFLQPQSAPGGPMKVVK